MEAELKSLQIDRSKRRNTEPSPWAVRWIVAGIAIFVALGAARFVYDKVNAATEVDIVRVHAASTAPGGESNVILNATGYIIAAHKIELASKVIGKVSWIGVEKGDRVKQGTCRTRKLR
jgi:HlyD family secretion protein